MTTAEILPNGHSILARLVIIEMSAGSVPVSTGYSEVLGRCQGHAAAGTYAKAMAGFLRHLARRRAAGETEGTAGKRRSDFHVEGGHRRGSGNLAELESGLMAFADYALAAGAIDADEGDRREAEIRACLRRLAERQRAETAIADPVARFVQLLRTVLLTGRGYLDRPQFPGTSEKPRGERIGWEKDSEILLSPEATLAAVNGLATETDQPLNQNVRSLGRLLNDAGKLARVDRRGGAARTTVRHTEDGVTHVVWSLNKSVVFGDAGGQDGQDRPERRETPTEDMATKSLEVANPGHLSHRNGQHQLREFLDTKP